MLVVFVLVDGKYAKCIVRSPLVMATHFQFVVRKDIGQTLGLHCGFVDGEALLRVNGIEEGGVIDKKNAKLESYAGDIRHQVLRADDIIECVNGQMKPHAIMRQLCLESVIHMRIRRGTLTDVVDALTAVASANERAEFFQQARIMIVKMDYDPKRLEPN